MEVLGLQNRRVRALTISVRVDEAVTITAEMYADEEQIDSLADLLAIPGGVVVNEVTPCACASCRVVVNEAPAKE